MDDRLVAIVGATATGKTELAIQMAERIGGEIVNADSRQIYRGMDIGTAKPTRDEQTRVRHWLTDCIAPDETFTLAALLDAANAALDDIWSRARIPILVGGTGQYVWALLEGWQVPRVAPDTELRAELDELARRDGPPAVLAILREIDAESADTIDPANVRRLIRAIEVTRATGRAFSSWREKSAPTFDSRIIGLDMPRDALYARIDARVDRMIDDGLVAEVESLIASGCSCALASMQSIGYRQICDYLNEGVTLSDTVERIKTETHRLARMQHTWFRSDDPRIHWIAATASDALEQAVRVATGDEASPEYDVSGVRPDLSGETRCEE